MHHNDEDAVLQVRRGAQAVACIDLVEEPLAELKLDVKSGSSWLENLVLARG